MYGPALTSVNRLKQYQSPSYQAVLFDQIVAKGQIQYQFLLGVFKPGAETPFLIVSSEKSSPIASLELADILGEEEDDLGSLVTPTTYFFCYFDEKGHHNLGSSAEWGELNQFENRALQFLQEKLNEAFQPI